MLINSYFCFLELKQITNKKIKMAHNIKPGVATGDQVQEIFIMRKKRALLYAVNVTGSNTINGGLETAAN
jgi:fructose-bisphosphate aldolase class II